MADIQDRSVFYEVLYFTWKNFLLAQAILQLF